MESYRHAFVPALGLQSINSSYAVQLWLPLPLAMGLLVTALAALHPAPDLATARGRLVLGLALMLIGVLSIREFARQWKKAARIREIEVQAPVHGIPGAALPVRIGLSAGTAGLPVGDFSVTLNCERLSYETVNGASEHVGTYEVEHGRNLWSQTKWLPIQSENEVVFSLPHSALNSTDRVIRWTLETRVDGRFVPLTIEVDKGQEHRLPELDRTPAQSIGLAEGCSGCVAISLLASGLVLGVSKLLSTSW